MKDNVYPEQENPHLIDVLSQGGAAMLPQFPDISLTLEQEFDLRKFKDLMKDLSRLEIEELLMMLLRQKMAHENISRSLIKEILRQEQMQFSHLLN